MAHTYGKWIVTHWNSHPDVHVSVDEGYCMRFICNCGNPKADTLPTNPDAEANARLIVSAVNACQKVNANNPIAVAESIQDMYEALKELFSEYQHWTSSYEGGAVDRVRELVNKALAKAEGK